MNPLLLLLLFGAGAYALTQTKKSEAKAPPQLPAGASAPPPRAVPPTNQMAPDAQRATQHAVEHESSPSALDMTAVELQKAANQATGAAKAQYAEAADAVRGKAGAIRSAVVEGDQVVRGEAQKGQLPTVLFQTMQAAIADGGPEALTSAAYMLRQAGFTQQADTLDMLAKKAKAAVPLPPKEKSAGATIEPALPPKLNELVTQALQTEGAPDKLRRMADWVEQQGFTAVAEQLRSKAENIDEAIAAKADAAKVDEVLKTSPGQPTGTLPRSATPIDSPNIMLDQMAAKVRAAQPNLPADLVDTVAKLLVHQSPDPVKLAQLASKYARDGYSEVAAMLLTRAKEAGYKPAKVKSPTHQLAEKMTIHLKTHPKYRENKDLVKEFQGQVGETTDGLYGRMTALAAAKYVVPQKPYYWPRKNPTAAERDFRAKLVALSKTVEDPTHRAGLVALSKDPKLGTPPTA